MKKVIFVIGLFVSSSSLFSQSENTLNEKQIKYGFNLGINHSNLINNATLPSNATLSNNLGFRLGILADYKIYKSLSISPKAEMSFNNGKINFINIDGFDFNLIGNADRVDFEGDLLRIIDYKTGKVESKEVEFSEYHELVDSSKKAKAFQLLMYAYLYLKMNPNYIGLEVVAGNFSFKNLKIGLITVANKIGKQREVIKIDAQVLDEFEEQLEFVLTKILNNDFEQTSEVKNCEWCDYKSVCRR